MKWLTLISLFLPSLARADVLMLNLNNNPKEVEAARAAAKKSGRDFFVFPDLNRDQVRTLAKLGAAKEKVMKKVTEACTGKSADRQKCLDASLASQRAVNDWNSYRLRLSLDKAAIRKFLEERERSGNPITTLVVSGHDGTGHFGGSLGGEHGIGDKELAELFKGLPKTSASLRSLHLWGCYTTSPGSLMLNWKKYFPNVALFSGYEGRAPLGDKPAGWRYLKGVIEREPQLLHIADSTKLKKALRRIPGALMVNAAVNVCDEYASIRDNYNLREMADRCEAYKAEIEAGGEEYECYYKASDDRCADVPADTERGFIRRFYELLHKASACQSIMTNPIFRTYSRDNAIRLVFDRQVRKNLTRNYREELLETDKLLEGLGAPTDLRFSGLDKISRKELLTRLERLAAFLRDHAPDPLKTDPATLKAGTREAEIFILSQTQRALSSTIMNPARCVPFNWVEPNEPELSGCLRKENMGLAAVAAVLKHPGELNRQVLVSMGMKLDALTARMEKSNPETHGSSALAAAKYNLYRALAIRLELYMMGGRAANAHQDKWVKWAELVLAATKSEKPQPQKDPAALRLALSLNQEGYQSSMESLKNNLESLKKRAGAAQAPEQRARISSRTASLARTEKIVETLGLLEDTVLAGGSEIPSLKKLQRIRDAEIYIGESAIAMKKVSIQHNLNHTNSELAKWGGEEDQGSGLKQYLEGLTHKKAKLERALKEFENLSPEALKARGEEELLTPYFVQERY